MRRYEDPPLVTHGKASEVLEAALTAGEPALNPHAVLGLGHLARRFRFLGPESVHLVERLGTDRSLDNRVLSAFDDLLLPPRP